MLYKVKKEHKVRSISSGIHTIEVGKEIEGIEQDNGYIRVKRLERDMYIPIEKVVEINITYNA